MKTSTLMVQGTTSDAGKSTLVTALCRALHRRHIKVCPFKPQNMALNSAVTVDGGEIGRAQAVQAYAACLEPHTDMNPVLLKPSSDTQAQIIIHGKALQDMQAVEYHGYKKIAMAAVLESYDRLSKQFDAIIVEGAGSPAEINLRDNDIANMGFAEEVDCPVILIADIDRGGVFAHLVGTLDCLSESEQKRVAGFVINQFRGDINLLTSGLEWLEKKTGKPVIGVLPFLHGLYIEAEDNLRGKSTHSLCEKLKIVIPALPRISNHTDFDSLRLQEHISVTIVPTDAEKLACDLVIIPGSKNTRADMQWLLDQGWKSYLEKHLRYGGKVLGICGGFQMLGKAIHDPQGIESIAGSSDGFGFLDFETILQATKTLTRVKGTLFDGVTVSGYEIHAGISEGNALANAMLQITEINGVKHEPPISDGVISHDNQIMGTYVHGLLDELPALNSILKWVGLSVPQTTHYFERRELEIERLADACEKYLDMKFIMQLLEKH